MMELEFHQLDRKYEQLRVRDHKRESQLLASLGHLGQQSPIVVLKASENAALYVVLDGFKRIRALQRLEQDTVQAMVVDENEADGLILVHHLQGVARRCALEEAYLVQVLRQVHGMGLAEIARRLGRSKSWVSRRLGLVTSLPKWLRDLVRDGSVPTRAAMRHLLPLARANKNDAETLAQNIKNLGLSSRQIGELYDAWRAADERGRELVVRQPEVVLRAREEGKSEPEGDEAKLFQALEKCLSLIRRSRRLLDRVLLLGFEEAAAKRISRLRTELRAHLSLFLARFEQEVETNARPGAPPCDRKTQGAGPQPTGDRSNAESLSQCGPPGT